MAQQCDGNQWTWTQTSGASRAETRLKGRGEVFLAPYKERLETGGGGSPRTTGILAGGRACKRGVPVGARPIRPRSRNTAASNMPMTERRVLPGGVLRLKILRRAYVYDAECGGAGFVRAGEEPGAQARRWLAQFQEPVHADDGQQLSLSRLKQLEVAEAQKLYEHPANQLIAGLQIEHIEQLDASIGDGWKRRC